MADALQEQPPADAENSVLERDALEPNTLTAAERAAKLEQRDQFGLTARAARDKGDIPSAIKAAEDMLAIELGLFGKNHKDVIGSLKLLAECHEALANFTAANRIREDLVLRISRAYGPDDYRVTDAKLAVQHVATLAALSVEQRKELSDAAGANTRVVTLYGQGQHITAVKLAERILEIRRRLLGEYHPDTAASLNNLAFLYEAQRNYAAAEPIYQLALEVHEKALGPDHPTTVMCLDNLAQLYNAQAHYAAAEPLYQRSLKIREKSLGSDHPNTATSLNNLAMLYNSQGNYVAAEPLYQRALKIREKVFGPEHPSTAMSLCNLAELYRAQGNNAAAEPLHRRALKICEKSLGPDHPSTAASLNNLALLYESQGNTVAAEPLYLRALKICEKSLGSDHPKTATSLYNLASLYEAQWNYAAAKPLHQRALKIRERLLGPDHPDTARSLCNLAELYRVQGNDAAAEPLYKQALKICEKSLGLDHLSTATSLNNLALLYESQGNSVAAEPLYLRALKIREKALGSDHPKTATSLNNLASLYESQGNYAAAEPLFQRALTIRERSLGPDHPSTAISHGNLAGLYESVGDYATAEPLYQRALKICEKSLGLDHPHTATSLNNLADLYYSLGQYAAAEPLFQRALKIYEKALGPDHPDTANSLNNLAFLQWNRDQAELAAPRAQRALGIELRHLDGTAAVQTEQQQFLMAHGMGTDISFCLTVSAPEAKLTEAVYRDVLAWKGLITARQHGLRRALKDDPLFAEFRRLTQQLSTVSLSPPLPPSDPQALAAWKQREAELRKNWESQKAALEITHERLEQELAVKSVPFRASLEQRRVQPADLVATLAAQSRPTALVDVLEYRYYGRKNRNEKSERRIVAFVVRGGRPVVRVELGAVDAIAPPAALWRESILRKGHPRDVCQELRQRVWLPLEAHLDGIETVLISTDGVLSLLPFAALPGREDGTLLIDDYRLAFVPVPQMIPGLLAKPATSLDHQRLLLVGDVDYGTDATGKQAPWKPLRGTDDELAALTRLHGARFPAADGLLTLQGAEATERQVVEQLAQFPVLHFATHGLFQQTEQRVIPHSQARSGTRGPEMLSTAFGDGAQTVQVTRSGLVLAGANRQGEARPDGTGSEVPEDGLLMDNEILAMPLEQAALVVMSACDTAQGKQQGGEGLLGIQRAFQVAGARTTVASLWPVDDAATVLLMQRFYENLWSGKMSKLDSLREAQLWMLQSGKQALRESARQAIARGQEPRGLKLLLDELDEQPGDRLPPFYWAAFELSGDWR